MMPWWDEKAIRWQERNRHGEIDRDNDYSERATRRATVHTREDITMVVAYLSALNRQTATIKHILAAIALMVAYLAIRLSV